MKDSPDKLILGVSRPLAGCKYVRVFTRIDMSVRNLEALFLPASVAVIGVSERTGSLGAIVLHICSGLVSEASGGCGRHDA